MHGVHSILFDSIEDAVTYAKQYGGWICKSEKAIQWFDASRWQPSGIIEATSGGPHGDVREIGTWPMFCLPIPTGGTIKLQAVTEADLDHAYGVHGGSRVGGKGHVK